MNHLENNAYFWQKIDTLLFSLTYKKSRDPQKVHPTYSNLVYPLEYGYLVDVDEGNKYVHIGVFKGNDESRQVNSVVICADILQKELDVKLLIGCNAEDEKAVLEFLNQTEYQKTILVRRGSELPLWASLD
ncbi:MAG: Inorganic pyrophosphatase [Erysipelothrix sp.]|nr:Inorganic pyrophosphatase [Erysipelothrix sp.]